jgi:hypothetical protein
MKLMISSMAVAAMWLLVGQAQASPLPASRAELPALKAACTPADADPKSCLRLAEALLSNEVVPQDVLGGLRALEVGCDKDDATACLYLGTALYGDDFGNGRNDEATPQEYTAAMAAWKKGCELGSAAACRNELYHRDMLDPYNDLNSPQFGTDEARDAFVVRLKQRCADGVAADCLTVARELMKIADRQAEAREIYTAYCEQRTLPVAADRKLKDAKPAWLAGCEGAATMQWAGLGGPRDLVGGLTLWERNIGDNQALYDVLSKDPELLKILATRSSKMGPLGLNVPSAASLQKWTKNRAAVDKGVDVLSLACSKGSHVALQQLQKLAGDKSTLSRSMRKVAQSAADECRIAACTQSPKACLWTRNMVVDEPPTTSQLKGITHSLEGLVDWCADSSTERFPYTVGIGCTVSISWAASLAANPTFKTIHPQVRALARKTWGHLAARCSPENQGACLGLLTDRPEILFAGYSSDEALLLGIDSAVDMLASHCMNPIKDHCELPIRKFRDASRQKQTTPRLLDKIKAGQETIQQHAIVSCKQGVQVACQRAAEASPKSVGLHTGETVEDHRRRVGPLCDSGIPRACHALADVLLRQPARTEADTQAGVRLCVKACVDAGAGCAALPTYWKDLGISGKQAFKDYGSDLKRGCIAGITEACKVLAEHTDKKGRKAVCKARPLLESRVADLVPPKSPKPSPSDIDIKRHPMFAHLDSQQAGMMAAAMAEVAAEFRPDYLKRDIGVALRRQLGLPERTITMTQAWEEQLKAAKTAKKACER